MTIEVGKTTLLQQVYEDEMIEEFDLKMWVCVSNNFDVKKIIADMLKSLKMNKPLLDTLYALQKSLKSEKMSKRFLLVLDDMCHEEEERDKTKWENVLASLSCGIWERYANLYPYIDLVFAVDFMNDWFCAKNSYSPTN
ncbi:Putative disease resistance protein RGA3 [Dendrobium catenatum]|uniref:Disease resistance protein RGA3 n=1 Tax=Dendrobium catenatum TaxID=906689 RepID=A0A2I0XI88_9ASPA|nr:Putative disease resistance protein RGA3 [Dendrobium catenatum]